MSCYIEQDDEYIASLQADQDKEMKSIRDAEARQLEEETTRKAFLEEEKKKEEEAQRKLEEEQVLLLFSFISLFLNPRSNKFSFRKFLDCGWLWRLLLVDRERSAKRHAALLLQKNASLYHTMIVKVTWFVWLCRLVLHKF